MWSNQSIHHHEYQTWRSNNMQSMNCFQCAEQYRDLSIAKKTSPPTTYAQSSMTINQSQMKANRRVLRRAVLVASDGGEVEYRRQAALWFPQLCLIVIASWFGVPEVWWDGEAKTASGGLQRRCGTGEMILNFVLGKGIARICYQSLGHVQLGGEEAVEGRISISAWISLVRLANIHQKSNSVSPPISTISGIHFALYLISTIKRFDFSILSLIKLIFQFYPLTNLNDATTFHFLLRFYDLTKSLKTVVDPFLTSGSFHHEGWRFK